MGPLLNDIDVAQPRFFQQRRKNSSDTVRRINRSQFCRRRLQNPWQTDQPIPIPWAIDGDWLISSADVFETSTLSCGLSLVMSSVKSVASWLAREMET